MGSYWTAGTNPSIFCFLRDSVVCFCFDRKKCLPKHFFVTILTFESLLIGVPTDRYPDMSNIYFHSGDELAVPVPADRSEPPSALVRIDGVMKSFGDKVALKNVTFSVPAGQICGLLGPNGARKTTLFRLLMGILKATYGKLLINRRGAFEDRVEAKRLIGFLPDEPVFYSLLSCHEVLELSAAIHGL